MTMGRPFWGSLFPEDFLRDAITDLRTARPPDAPFADFKAAPRGLCGRLPRERSAQHTRQRIPTDQWPN